MAGSTIIFSPDESSLQRLAEDLDNLSDFKHLNLDCLLTLDFSIITTEANTDWVDGEPVVLNEEAGLGIFKISKPGIDAVLNFEGELEDQNPEEVMYDIERLRLFIEDYGYDHIYEMASF